MKTRSLRSRDVAPIPVVLAAAAFVAAWITLRASLPQLDGVVHASELSANVAVDRDALGVPTIRGADRGDLAYATGFLHAQDRFFQMDLLRRTAAGELAELFGPAALELDRRHRLYQFRKRAAAALAAAPPDERRVIDLYTRGVNDGLNALFARPFEYLVLRVTPVSWRPEDSVLVVYAMYFDLQYHELQSILARELLRQRLSDDVFSFLLPDVSHWDAPLDQAASPTVKMPIVPATAPSWQRYRGPSAAQREDIMTFGSNSWAVAGPRSRRGEALLADDMHLGLRLPNIWYRLSLIHPDATGKPRQVTGVSLPGAPAIIVGSNGHVAWGFTNSSGHYLDLIGLDDDTMQTLTYHVAGGATERATREVERIAVKGARPVDLPIVETGWGPAIEVAKKIYAVHWVTQDPNAVNLNLLRMEDTDNAATAMKTGQASGIPTQNIIVADRDGHIGWTLAGPLPRRSGSGDGLPISGRDDRTWADYLVPDDYPALLDPPLGLLWSANNRQLSSADQDKIGGKDADMGARASQIRDALLMGDQFDERSLLAIQLDDRALWIASWRQLLLDALDDAALVGHPERAEMRRLVGQWNGRADADSVGYTLVRSFYRSMYDAWFGGLDAELRQVDPGASYRAASPRVEAVMEALAKQHAWVPSGTRDWREFLLGRIDAAVAAETKDGAQLRDAQWGAANRAAIAHPFVQFMPWLARWLAVPRDLLSGDVNMPRVQAPEFGASERMVIAPGHEETGILQMPGGQSGHPLSPFFLAGHEAWVRGEPSPFLPGPAVHHLLFER
ncbi:penicillin acylase family protein [Bradyrhizobium sp. HKCCYLS1011]|uniref:penicillin acylase family protein n=1 Tax=Bradyrhizobium sp. HKCCYLS1011 TaxID=3420733 RepID=UPI003EC0D74B